MCAAPGRLLGSGERAIERKWMESGEWAALQMKRASGVLGL